uniref:SAP30 binding protein n=1 Tax=Taeniopygia guttata TaxID=59729 RepID=H0YWU8_TAEGU
MVGARSALSLLEVYTEDSEPEWDGEAGTAGSDGAAPTGEKGGLVSAGYGEGDFTRLDGDEEGYEEEEEDGNSRRSEDDNSQTEKPEERDPQELVLSFSETVWNMSPDEIKIPPEPLGSCSNQLQDKIKKLYEWKMKEGIDMNYIIQNKKEFCNPSIYEKLIQFCSIDEIGTNYPKDMFDPHSWSEDSYYEALAKAQKTEMDKLKKAKEERTKIEFVTACSSPIQPGLAHS